jgi:uncharacterized protein (UPF0332 family)
VNDPAQRRNIAESLARAAQALAVADAALAIGGTADAVSLTYHAALHYLRARLFARWLDPRSHPGAHHLFNQEFVRSGLFPPKVNKLLAALQRMREQADYDPGMLFDAEDAREQIAEVRALGDRATAILWSERWLDP